ncbi:hypothetical protein [Acetivibrio cellulolyticus]|uniref:hypothetical protein n=1 Tax=Acetivibrio cellulolyticus TaxID=35830 RepID=UPI0001E2F14E|nr:hypothetical protein [Acetivibrio cellulolyticus]
MKRIQFACLEQTIRFELKEEVDTFKKGMDKKRVLYKILEESSQPDGSTIIKLKRQYNSYDCGDYLK